MDGGNLAHGDRVIVGGGLLLVVSLDISSFRHKPF